MLGRVAYPYTRKPEDVLKTQQIMRQASRCCGDVQARGAYLYFFKWLWNKEGVGLHRSGQRLQNGDLKRYRKDSIDWYQKVIASNGEDLC